jgi:peptidyl-prolyl cis-trans isomerase SurA
MQNSIYMTRRLFFALAFLIGGLSVSAQSDPVIMTINSEAVTLEDFESIFRKNNRDTVITKESLDEYIDLFVNFKLKVAEAKSLGMDTVQTFITELDGYRRQLARPYLTDSEKLDELIDEAYQRTKEEIKASHILITCDAKASPADTLIAYNKIMKIRNRISAGEDFTAVSKETSQDPTAKENGGDLGYFTAFQMVYPFESAAFKTGVGQVSQPVRTRFGYHLVKVVDRRPARGEILCAHIMVRAKSKDAVEEKKAVDKINDIYQQLVQGAEFSEMALKYSEDATTARKGGELPWFDTGKMVEPFENAAFKLAADGDFSGPFKTEYGWHIVKRIEYKPVPDFETVKKDIKNKVSRDSRADITRQSFINKMKTAYNYSADKKCLAKMEASFDTTTNKVTMKEKHLAKTLIMLDGQAYPCSDFAQRIEKRANKRRNISISEMFDKEFTEYTDNLIIDYEDSKLESKYDAFRLLMNEYRDGILLFELTDEKVWSRAVKDTLGLEEFYGKNKDKFMWKDRVQATIYTCKDQKIAADVKVLLDKGTSTGEILDKINAKSQLNLQTIEGTYSMADQQVLSKFEWKEGVSAPISLDGQVVIVDMHKIIPATPKALSEARGLITAEYQNYLEEQWIAELRNKYQYKVNQEVLYSLIN